MSKTLVEVLGIFDLSPGKKGKNLKIPEQILLSNNETARAFLRAYFDCDSYPSSNRNIEIISESRSLIQQTSLLLRRFGVLSTISKKFVNSVPYWRSTIKAKYAEIYADKIGYLIKEKERKVSNYKEIGEVQGHGNQDMIALGKLLKALRIQLGFSIGEIQTNAVYSYGRYEEKGLISKGNLKKLIEYCRNKKGIFLEFLEDLDRESDLSQKYSREFINGSMPYFKKEGYIQSNQIAITGKGQDYLSLIRANEESSKLLLNQLEYIANSKICWIPIKSISRKINDRDFVYDLTVEDNHSFIAEGIIVHNTTTISKLAQYYAKRGNKVCAVGLDVHRPAASEQLKQLGEKINIPVFIDPKEKDPKKIWNKYKKEIAEYSLVLVDTAGRDSLSADLIKEIKDIVKLTKPTETLLVIPADIGQAAKTQAEAFKKATNVSGVIITRMDSTAKGGGALTACSETKSPIVFIGTGEKPADLETFDPDSFLSRMLGMGDLAALIEKVHTAAGTKAIEASKKALEEGKFTMRDLETQLEAMGEMGSFDKLLSLVPGLGKAKEKLPEDAMEMQEKKVKRWKAAIKSMTPEEIEHPELLEKQTSRIQRISKGSGVPTSDIRALIKQYKMMKSLIASQSQLAEGKLDQKTMMKLAKKFGKKMKF